MGHATRFDLSRLEGCTGTITQSRAASSRELRATTADSIQENAQMGAPDATIGTDGRDGTEVADLAGARPSAGDESRAPASAAATAVPARIESAAPPERRVARPDGPEAENDVENRDRIGFGLVLALTLAAWIPVLWILAVWK